MNTFNVLITSVSKKVPLIKAVLCALEAVRPSTSNITSKIISGDCNISAIGRYFVDEFWHMPPQDMLTIEEVIEFCKKRHIRAIIPTRDGELPFFSRYKERLGGEGISCLVSSPKTVELCRDKLQFYTFLSKHHLPAIPTSGQISDIKAHSYAVKECFGAGSASIGLDLPLAEAKLWGNKLKHPIYQPYILGTEFSVDLYVDKHGTCLGSIVRERELICDGESQVTASVKNPDIDTLCHKAAALLNISGPAVFQILCDQSKHLHLIECNPRFGGASTLSVAMGLKIFEWFFQESLQLPLTPFERSPQELRQIRYAEDLILKK
ncbi:MAG: ATP-grasp domain-containing protein [Parachlamydiaceae bacterium]